MLPRRYINKNGKSNPLQWVFDSMNRTLQEKMKVKNPTPVCLDLEATNICNMKCNMCPAVTKMKRDRGYMDLGLALLIADQAKDWQPRPVIRFIRWGEPTLHPEFFALIDIFKSRGLTVHFNTNGKRVAHPYWVSRILESGVDSVKISLQGLNRQEYINVRGADQLNELHWLARSLFEHDPQDRPFVLVGTTADHADEQRKERFLSRFLPVCDMVTIGETIDFDIPRDRPPTNCPEIYDKMSIDWDGTVVACCSDWDQGTKYAKAYEKDLKEIWNDWPIQNVRRRLESGNPIAFCRECRRC